MTGLSAPVSARLRRRASASGRYGLHHLDGERRDVGALVRFQGQGLELGDQQHLIDEPAHARHVLTQGRGDGLVAQCIEMGRQDGERRAELVCGVGREIALGAKTAIEPVQCGIDRMHRRRQFTRQALDRQAPLALARRNQRCFTGQFLQRAEAPAKGQRPDRQRRKQRRQ